jgi:single-strand DNA-binding protein
MSCLNLNKVVLAGRLTNDPELKQTPSGVSVLSFTLAVNRRYASKNEQGESQTQADFISVVAWRNTAEFIARYFKKGSAICITGSIQTRSWQDQQGQRRYATEVVADEAMFVDSRSESGMSDGYQTPAFSSTASVTPSFEEHNTDDDLPF